MSEQVKKAVVLLSGGLDSATALGIALEEGYEVYPLTFSYGQRHAREVAACLAVKLHYCEFPRFRRARAIELDMAIPPHVFFKSALTDPEAPLPSGGPTGEVPTTYVPMRNTVFLSIAAAYAEVLGAEAIFVGFNQVDYSGYPDCRGEYVEAMQAALRAGSNSNKGLTIRAPLLHDTKAGILRRAVALGVPYQLTWSCYKGGEIPCGTCDSCVIRDAAFKEVFSGE